MPNLIRVHPSNLSCFEVEDERYGPPIVAALATGSDEAVQTFLEIKAEIHPPTSQLRSLCKQYCQNGNKRASFGREFTFSRKRAMLSYVAEHGDEILLAFLLETGEYVADSKDEDGETPLLWAARRGHETVVRLLLKTSQVDADSKNKYGWTPLSLAAGNGDEAIIKLLLGTGQVDADSKDEDGRTPLSQAAMNGHEAVVRLLLGTGKVDANSKDKFGQTPLSRAAENRNEAVVELLRKHNN